jgi:2',3'-cyclic-nucleotide 2'-phosphodiesterase
MFKILFFGDIVGSIGRRGVVQILPELKAAHHPDLIIANVENLAHGRGITAKTLSELDRAGVDAYTSGNHVWENPLGLSCFDDPQWKDRLIRPANVMEKRAGKGTMLLQKNGATIFVVNLMGRLFMKDELASPFGTFDELVKNVKADMVLVDLHTETTSEKEAFGHYVDGRATAVFGTHTHVPTADQKMLSGGTAYVTDVGRNGGYDSVVGFEKTAAVRKFLEVGAKAYDPPDKGPIEINAMLLEVDLDTKRPFALQRIRKIVDG